MSIVCNRSLTDCSSDYWGRRMRLILGTVGDFSFVFVTDCNHSAQTERIERAHNVKYK